MTTDFDRRAREIGQSKLLFQIMLDVVNEWHQQVGIDAVMETKLTRAIADTVASRVFERSLSRALRQVEAETIERCAQKAEYMAAGSTVISCIATAIRALGSEADG